MLDLLRFMAINYYYQVYPLSADERLFYKLFFAALSLISGLAIVLEIWFYRAFRFGEKTFFARNRILNDQRMLQWSFLHWFVKLSFMFGFSLDFAFHGSDMELNFYQNYPWLFPLILSVLFLNLWKNLLLVYRVKALRYLLLSAGIIGGLSFIFSQWNLVDIAKLERKIAQKNPYERFDIQLVESDLLVPMLGERSFNEEYFILEKDSLPSSIQFYATRGKKLLSIGEYQSTLYNNHYFRQHYIPGPYPLRFVLDRNAKVASLMQAYASTPKPELRNTRLAFSFQNSAAYEHYDLAIHYYGSATFDPFIPPPPAPPFPPSIFEKEHLIMPAANDQVYYNGSPLNLKKLENAAANAKPCSHGIYFNFKGWEQISYERFFVCLIAIRKGLDAYQKNHQLDDKPALSIRLNDIVYSPDSTLVY